MGRSFEKRRNWYGPVDDADPEVAKLIKKLETISDNDSNPHAGQKVFEIKGRTQAADTEKVEKAVANPRGTVENPVPVPGKPTKAAQPAAEAAPDAEATAEPTEPEAEPEAPKRRSRRGGRSSE